MVVPSKARFTLNAVGSIRFESISKPKRIGFTWSLGQLVLMSYLKQYPSQAFMSFLKDFIIVLNTLNTFSGRNERDNSNLKKYFS